MKVLVNLRRHDFSKQAHSLVPEAPYVINVNAWRDSQGTVNSKYTSAFFLTPAEICHNLIICERELFVVLSHPHQRVV